MDASSTRPCAASLAGSGTKLFGAVCRLIPLKGKHKPLIHPPLAPAATQGLFFAATLSPATAARDPAAPRRIARVESRVWYPHLRMCCPGKFITPLVPPAAR